MSVRRFILKYYNKLSVTTWVIGFYEGTISEIIKNKKFNPDINWLKAHSADCFYADPFIIKTQNETYKILVEDFSFNHSLGNVSLLSFDTSMNLADKKVLLNTGMHYSYPFVFSENNKIYVFPESSADGNLSCYEYNLLDDSFTLIREIINLPVVDPTILKYQDKYWLFCTLRDDPDASLHIYISDSLLGNYKPHPKNPVVTSGKFNRSAGNFMEIDGFIYRPSQNNINQYGESIIINRIRELSEQTFKEDPYLLLKVNKKNKLNKGIKGIHTINAAGNLIVVDGWIRKFAPLKKLKYFLKKRMYIKSAKTI